MARKEQLIKEIERQCILESYYTKEWKYWQIIQLFPLPIKKAPKKLIKGAD